ncbi:UDP-glucose 4-epimerase GalE [Pseudomaricurvus alcaniphilus]|uniref:UDP-glucose 4-epimerase GalE n=1 Tax=Pseudomaricurvus alcaniphilus TaxID=1166482 RepID=UPI00140827E8|nr:UDP-glucose 4-epimerase GalE [Pseudomaricurvus alcaniphilus]
MNTRETVKTVLVTGGAGYIGSHTCVELLQQGYEVVVVDNLVNAQQESLNRVAKIAGKAPVFLRVDLLDEVALDAVFSQYSIDAVIHFAALKAVGESVAKPLAYYHNNMTGTLNLFRVMAQHQVFQLVYSSSATVYGDSNPIPYREDMPLASTSPYGRSKVMAEQIMMDLSAADERWNIASLRYFNPVGAHPSGLIGEDPTGIPNNLMPYISQVAVGRREHLSIYGNDYMTADGTGVRDYIHVVDLANGHLQALQLLARKHQRFSAYNLGAGKGFSVLDVVKAFEKACGQSIPYKFEPRRAGDIGEFYADASKAATELDWRAARSLDSMCADTWNWQSKNPSGYGQV